MATPNIPEFAKVCRLPASKDQYTDVTALRVLDEPVELPTKGQVLVKLHAASLNFRQGDIPNYSDLSTDSTFSQGLASCHQVVSG